MIINLKFLGHLLVDFLIQSVKMKEIFMKIQLIIKLKINKFLELIHF